MNVANEEATMTHYREPGFFTRRIMQPLMLGAQRLGISLWGSRSLEVRGRRSGEPRRVPVNLLTVDEVDHLVAPRGITQWVRNLRAAGEAELLLGRRRDRVRAVEVVDQAEQVVLLREYLRRWKWEVGVFFDGASADSTDAELAAIAPKHPIFRLEHLPAPA